jgi:predicted oxidoreductase
MGLEFRSLGRQPGNSVRRIHSTLGGGRALVTTLYRESLKYPNVEFMWNYKVTDLVQEGGRISGVAAENLRTGEARTFRASAVILATGGFQSNLEMVREFWPQNLKFPDRLLFSAGFNATGSGHELAQEAGGVLHYMDHQWNYSTGIPHPRHQGTDRGLSGGSSVSIWVNAQGKRFVNESASPRYSFPAIVNQTSSTYWAIFDDQAGVRMSGTGWDHPKQIISEEAPDLMKSADSIEELARKAGLSADVLRRTVDRYNAMVDQGKDEDFGRFDSDRSPSEEIDIRPHTPQRIEQPPFYAVQSYPVTRKSMGGVSIDLSCRVLDRNNQPIPGLYAVGELTGLAQINGKAALEGTFLGPSIVTGRVAAQSALAELGHKPAQLSRKSSSPTQQTSGGDPSVENETCLECHSLPQQVNQKRPGYDHFERVHRLVLSEGYECISCHSEMAPVVMESHRFDRAVQAENCARCH